MIITVAIMILSSMATLIDILCIGHYSNIVKIEHGRSDRLAKAFTLSSDVFMHNKAFREVCMSRILRHKNIIEMSDIVVSRNRRAVYLVMEEGSCTAYDEFKAGTQGIEEKKKMLNDTSKGLMYLHDNNISHCDLSMLNVVRVGDRYKLIDFGNAIKGHRFSTYTESAPYIMPYDRPKHISVDIWALGCMAYTVYNNKLPFAGLSREMQSNIIALSSVYRDSEYSLKFREGPDTRTIKKMLNINSNKRCRMYFSNSSVKRRIVCDEKNDKISCEMSRCEWRVSVRAIEAVHSISRSNQGGEIDITYDNIYLPLLNSHRLSVCGDDEYVERFICMFWLSLKLTHNEIYYVADLSDWLRDVCGVTYNNDILMERLMMIMQQLKWDFDVVTIYDVININEKKITHNLLFDFMVTCIDSITPYNSKALASDIVESVGNRTTPEHLIKMKHMMGRDVMTRLRTISADIKSVIK